MKYKGKKVPKREEWLHKNPEALKSVERGLEQAKRGELSEGPDLDADKMIIAKQLIEKPEILSKLKNRLESDDIVD